MLLQSDIFVQFKLDYFERLSSASIHTLNLQGGPMSEYEVREFEKNDYLEQCINLRHWDEEAKDPEQAMSTIFILSVH